MKTATQILRQRRPRARLPSRHRPAVRRQRRVADHGLEERNLREVSAYSTVCPEPAREAAYSQRPLIQKHSIRYHLKMRSDRPPRFRKACNLPVLPRLPTASCHSARVSISSATSETLNRSAARRAPQPVFLLNVHSPCLQLLPGSSVVSVFPLFDDNEALRPRQRNLDNKPPCSYRYEFQPSYRMKAALTRTPPPICTFAPGTQTALIWRTVGRRERLKKYTMGNF